MLLDLVVQVHHMKDIEKLSLVLVETLHLHVEYGAGIYFNAIVLQNIVCQPLFVLIFDIHELGQGFGIICILFQSGHKGQIRDPVLCSQFLCHPVCQKRVPVHEETSLGDTVCLVVELLRHHLVEVLQLLVLQDLCVKPCHAVYGKACHDGKVCHAHLSVVEDGHLLYFLLISRVHLPHLDDEPAVDLLDDLVHTREQLGEQIDRPLLQGLCHDRMIRVGTALCSDVPRLVPAKPFLVQKDAHQLCHSHCGMCIVHLEEHFLRQLVDVVVCSLIFCHSSLNAG